MRTAGARSPVLTAGSPGAGFPGIPDLVADTWLPAARSGKSTLLHLLGAIDAPDSGTIEVGGTDITGLDRGRLAAYRATVGFVFQRFHLLPALSARDNVTAPAVPRQWELERAS